MNREMDYRTQHQYVPSDEPPDPRLHENDTEVPIPVTSALFKAMIEWADHSYLPPTE